jgi:hypothetical protein
MVEPRSGHPGTGGTMTGTQRLVAIVVLSLVWLLLSV